MALIDRESERRQIESFLDDSGSGTRALLLSGEAGIGKTTLWQAALEGAGERGYRIITTRPTEAEARLPLAGLNDLFGELVEVAQGVLPPPQQAAIDVALMRADVGDEPIQPLALSLAVLELVRIASRERPLALAMDDVQWLDDSTAGVLRFALRRVDQEPVIVIATERSSSDATFPDAVADLSPERVTRVAVSPLEPMAIDRLLDESLGLRLAPTLLRRVHRMSGGNPFYALEVGRVVQARRMENTADEIALPDSLTGLLRERLASLSSDGRAVTVHAAALSQPTTPLIEAALGVEPARAGLAAAEATTMLTVAGDHIRFTHPLLAAEAYGELDETQRRDVHRRLAAVVAEPEELARHLALATPGPDPDVAATLDAAANHAASRGAPDAAAELAELAARLTTVTDAERARRMAAAGRHRLMAGDVERSRELLERALEEPAAARGVARAELLFRLAGVRQLLDDFEASDALGREALRHAGDDVALTIQVKLLLAGVAFITGRGWKAGAKHASEAMRLADAAGDPGLVATAIGAYLSWRYATGHGLDSELVRRADALELETRHFRTLDLPEFDIASIEASEGMTASAYARLGKLVDRAEHDGDYSSLPFLLATAALGDFLDGRRDDARERLGRSARLAMTTGQHTARVHTLVGEARIEARLGNSDRAIAAGREAFQLMEDTKWRVGDWWMRTDLAVLQLSLDDPSAALEYVAGSITPSGADDAGRRRWAQPAAVEALVALGRHDEAALALDIIEAESRARDPRRLRADRLRARARFLASTGDIGAAEELIGQAEALHRDMGDGWELARTMLVVGEVHRRARRRAMARAALREALETFVFLGARLWARQAREQLARISGARQPGELTPTQHRVAELAASGLTNRQVADRLSMSPHTVEAHLSAAYQALGIRSRSELSGALATEPAPMRDSAGRTRDTGPS